MLVQVQLKPVVAELSPWNRCPDQTKEKRELWLKKKCPRPWDGLVLFPVLLQNCVIFGEELANGVIILYYLLGGIWRMDLLLLWDAWIFWQLGHTSTQIPNPSNPFLVKISPETLSSLLLLNCTVWSCAGYPLVWIFQLKSSIISGWKFLPKDKQIFVDSVSV